MENKLQETLQTLGLTDKESQLYLALLKSGSATIAQAAGIAGLKRPTAYVLADSLLEREYLTVRTSGKEKLYSPVKPVVLRERLAEKLTHFDAALPLLQGLMSQQAGRPQVEVREGKQAIIDAYFTALASGEELLFFTDINTLSTEFDDFLVEFNAKVVTELKQVRELVGNTFQGRKYAREAKPAAPHRQVKLMENPLQNDTVIYGDTLLIVSFKEHNYFLVTIKNADIAASFRIVFEQLWKTAKKAR